MHHYDPAAVARLRAALEAAGTSAPIKLEADDAQLLVHAVNIWLWKAHGQGLPEGVWRLRCALIDDLHDTASGH